MNDATYHGRDRRAPAVSTVVSIISLGILLFVQTAALFYWGGQVRELLRGHEERIGRLERLHDNGK